MRLKYKNLKYENLKQVLKNEFNISNRLISILKLNDSILVNGNVSNINDLIYHNDIIEINLDFPETDNENIIPVKMDLDVLFEDNSMLVVNKPSNMPVHPSILHYNDTLSNGVKYYFNENNIYKSIRPVNRLDKDTTGIVIFAKNQYVQEELIKQMKKNIFKKEYYAILDGHLEKEKGIIEASISRKEGSIIEREINSTGEKAITHFELIKKFEFESQKLSFVKFVLETGRTHQIRVHSKYIGHPILGDTLYGNPSSLISRQALHSCKIQFIKPISKTNMIIESNIPEDMAKIIKESI